MINMRTLGTAAGPAPARSASQVHLAKGTGSALLAGVALAGVTISLIRQERDARASREQGLRAIHTELLRMAMDDPLYRHAWGPNFDTDDPDIQREQIYVNLIISWFQVNYELKAVSEKHLRESAYILLSGEAGQRFWIGARELRLRTSDTRRDRRFHEIMDEEYQRALRSPATATPAQPANPGESALGAVPAT